MLSSNNKNILNSLFVIWLLFSLTGCSVIMAMRQPSYKDVSMLGQKTPRSKVIAELGNPLLTEEKEGKKIDTFVFTQGYGNVNKAARAFFHTAADIWTLFLWEVIGTPAEIIASGRKMKLQVAYDENDMVEKITEIKDKTTAESVEPKSIKQAVTPPTQKNPTLKLETFDSKIITNHGEYFRYIHNTILKNVVRPQGSASGVINISLTLLRDGTLENFTILESSSEDIALRESVEKAVKNSLPFAPFPKDIEGEDKKNFMVTLEFRYQP